MEMHENRMWQSILSALDRAKESKVWIVMVIGVDDYTWYPTVVELPGNTPYHTLEEEASKIVRLNLQESNIYPSFVKMKSLTYDKEQIRDILGSRTCQECT